MNDYALEFLLICLEGGSNVFSSYLNCVVVLIVLQAALIIPVFQIIIVLFLCVKKHICTVQLFYLI